MEETLEKAEQGWFVMDGDNVAGYKVEEYSYTKLKYFFSAARLKNAPGAICYIPDRADKTPEDAIYRECTDALLYDAYTGYDLFRLVNFNRNLFSALVYCLKGGRPEQISEALNRDSLNFSASWELPDWVDNPEKLKELKKAYDDREFMRDCPNFI